MAEKRNNPHNSEDVNLPRAFVVATAVAWRSIIIVVCLIGLYLGIKEFETFFIPLSLGLLITALLNPVVHKLRSFHIPKIISTFLSLILFFAIISILGIFVYSQVQVQLGSFIELMQVRVRETQDWLEAGPLHINSSQLNNLVYKLQTWIQENSKSLLTHLQSGAIETAGAVAEFATGIVLTFFITLFLLFDGEKVWEFLTRIIPKTHRKRVNDAGHVGFKSLTAYMRATVGVAAADAIGIWIGISIQGVPLAAALSILVFMGAFIPIVGAFVAGFLAVLVALIAKGLVAALITLVIIIAVMQIEGHILQPLFLGKAVQIHALGVIAAITIGTILFGIWGALIAVPTTAVMNAAIRAYYRKPQVEESE